FGMGNLMLKIKRNRLPRPERATILSVIVAISFILAAFFGNLLLNAHAFYVFLQYLIPAMLFIIVMLKRAQIIKWTLYSMRHLDKSYKRLVLDNIRLHRALVKINAQELVFFTRGDNVAVLNRVMIYVEENEATKKIKIVHIANSDSDNENLKSDILVLDRAYPEIDIDFVEIEGEFGPELIEQLSQKWEIPKNFMFIGSPGDKFPYHVSELGGVRLIM
ncbi:MAG: APC family permease, partial [Flavobacterium sp.]